MRLFFFFFRNLGPASRRSLSDSDVVCSISPRESAPDARLPAAVHVRGSRCNCRFLLRVAQLGHFLVKQHQLFTIGSLRFRLADGFLSPLRPTSAFDELLMRWDAALEVQLCGAEVAGRSSRLATLTTPGDPDDGWKSLFLPSQMTPGSAGQGAEPPAALEQLSGG